MSKFDKQLIIKNLKTKIMKQQPEIEEVQQTTELQELINTFARAIGHLGFDIVSIEGVLNRIDPNLLEPSDINKTPEQQGDLGTLRHLSYLLENEVGKVEAIKRALKKLA